MRVNAYIDGFNLFYGLKSFEKSGANYRWLNLFRLCQVLVPQHTLNRVRYFSARVDQRRDPFSPMRQNAYLRALASIPQIDIHLGQFLSGPVRMRLAHPTAGSPATVEVLKTEEKGSDVNLATYLLLDCFRKEFDLAIVITNDSDLVEPIGVVRNEFGCTVGVFNPQKRYSNALKTAASFYTKIREDQLRTSQFPNVVADRNGVEVACPLEWRQSFGRDNEEF